MTYQAIKLIHVLSLFVWLGGLIFSQFFLAKPMTLLNAAQHARLTRRILLRFFNAIAVASVLAMLSGLWMIGRTASLMKRSGLHFEMPWSWMAMALLGTLMIAMFAYMWAILYRRLSRAVKAADWTRASAAQVTIRHWMTTSLGIGIVVIGIAMLG